MAFDLTDEELQATREMNKTAWESEIDKWSKEYLIERYKDLVEIEEEHKKENGELREELKNSISTLKIEEIINDEIEELFKEMDELDIYDEDENEEKRTLSDMIVLLKQLKQELLQEGDNNENINR